VIDLQVGLCGCAINRDRIYRNDWYCFFGSQTGGTGASRDAVSKRCSRGTGEQQREVHIYARSVRTCERAARYGIVLAVGYQIGLYPLGFRDTAEISPRLWSMRSCSASVLRCALRSK